jgi:hypothetical protein
MISQISNNKPSGYQSVDCDAGIPISGRTASNGSYQILKLSDTGSLLVQSGIDASAVAYQIESNVGTPTGAIGGKVAGIFLGTTAVITTAISSGFYTISPSFIAEANSGGAITLILVKVGTTLDAYAGTLNAGTDAFLPSLANIQGGGLACLWHTLPLNNRLSTSIMSATGGNANTLEKTVYLEAGSYNMISVVDTAITTAGTGQIIVSLQSLIQVA